MKKIRAFIKLKNDMEIRDVKKTELFFMRHIR